MTTENKKEIILASVLVAISFIINSSRGPLIMFILFFYIFTRNYFSSRIFVFLLLILVLFSQFFIQDYFLFTSDRLINIFQLDESGGSSLYRYKAHTSIPGYLIDNPFGNGLKSFNNYFPNYTDLSLKYALRIPPDSTFALVSYNSGIIGLILLFSVFISLLRLTFKKSIPFILAVCLLLNFMTDEKFNGSIFISILALYITSKKQ